MESVTVDVEKDGRFIASIERPLHNLNGKLAVRYKRRLWLVEEGRLRLELGPIDEGGDQIRPVEREPVRSPGARPVHYPVVIEDPVDVDDSDVRHRIVDAPPTAQMLVEAGPGTGKTEMAARRLGQLVKKYLSPSEILVLSFSRSAVRTLTRRFSQIEYDERVLEELRFLSVRTFDSWAFRMLRHLGHEPSRLLRNGHDANIELLVAAAQGPKADVLRKLIGNRKHLIVDELQDLPGVRGDLVLALLSLLAPPTEEGFGFTILGDPAQAIYGFAAGNRPDGSEYPTPREYWDEIEARYSGSLQVEKLRRNYRSGSDLGRLSAQLRRVLLGDEPPENRLETVLAAISELPESSEPLSPAYVEAAGKGSRAILTRTNGEALQVLRALVGRTVAGASLPIRLRAGHCDLLPPPWIAGLLSPLRASTLQRTQFNRIYAHLHTEWPAETQQALGLPSEEAAWDRLANASGRASEDGAINLDDLRERLVWPDAFPDDQSVVDQGIIVTTVHQSKGMEFDFVTLLEGPEATDDTDDEQQDDPGAAASVGYVGITRAGEHLDRVPHRQIQRPLYQKEFRSARRRLYNHSYGWINVEIGLPRDIEPTGFIDPELHGSAEAIAELQQFLLENARMLEGRKVILCKEVDDDEAFWLIHLQELDDSIGRLLGRTTTQLTRDLLDILHPRYILPGRIFNLRISSVGTVCGASEAAPLSTEGVSRLWLGVGLFGAGDFKPKRRSNG